MINYADMTRGRRRIILWIFVALFLISSIYTVFLSLGFRIDWQSFKITKIGGIYISTSVPGAKIYISDKYVDTTSGLINYSRLIQDLIPKNYDIFIYKEGFYPWNKTVRVNAGEVSEFKNITLFPISPKIEKIAPVDAYSLIRQFPKATKSTDSFRIRKNRLQRFDETKNRWLLIDNGVNLMAISPDGNFLIYAATTTEVKMYSVATQKIETVFSPIENIHYIAWLPNSAYFLTVSGTTLTVIELNNIGGKRNSINLLFDVSAPAYYDASNDFLYFNRGTALYKTHIYTQ